MISLRELREMSKAVFPGSTPDLLHMICAWLKCDPDQGLSKLFLSSGTEVASVIRSFEPLFEDEPSAEDATLLESCICNTAHREITGFHLLHAIVHNNTSRLYKSILASGVDEIKFKKCLSQMIEGIGLPKNIAVQEYAGKSDGFLSEFGRDLSKCALAGSFDQLYHRESDIGSVLDVLLRRGKANPVITGPAGVGKTCLIEALSAKLARNEVSCLAPGTRVFELQIGKLVSGTKYRGDFEQRFYRIIEEIIRMTGTILFIDELHLIAGAGSAEGVACNAANLLKPFLDRDKLRVIGATTHQEFEKFIRPDPSLERRFQEVKLEPPDDDVLEKIIMKQIESLASFHNLIIPKGLAKEVIKLTDRFFPHRCQPDISVDLLDSAAGHAKKEDRLTLASQDILETISKLIGKPVRPKTESLLNHAQLQYQVNSSYGLSLIGKMTDDSIRHLIETYLKEIKFPYAFKGLEIVYDSDRLLDFLCDQLKTRSCKYKNIKRVVEDHVLQPIFNSVYNAGGTTLKTKIVLEDEFYTYGKV